MRCAAGGRALWAPRLTMINYKFDSIANYVGLTVTIDITRKITKSEKSLLLKLNRERQDLVQ